MNIYKAHNKKNTSYITAVSGIHNILTKLNKLN